MNEIIETKNNTLPERFKALREQAAAASEVWEPVAGECLVGQLIGHQRASGIYGENYQILIKDENGNVTAAWLTQWLKENLGAQGADVGDLIAITFLGKKQSPAGRIYNAYSLVVSKTPALVEDDYE
jgi:hypothetical protein